MDISEMINQHYELVPSILMRVLISIFLFLHSIIIGIGITLNFATSTLNAQIIIATILERLCDSFTFAAFIGNNKINKVFYWILMSLYCLSTPAAIIGFNYSNTHIKINDNQDIIGALASVSAGAYIFVGVLFWRKCFLDPFEFKKKEYIVISLIFAFGIIIHTLTSIPSKS